MSNEVEVPFGDSAQDTATLLLGAAEEAGEDASVIRTGERVFYAPEALAKKAGVDYEGKPAAKKATAKKTAKKG